MEISASIRWILVFACLVARLGAVAQDAIADSLKASLENVQTDSIRLVTFSSLGRRLAGLGEYEEAKKIYKEAFDFAWTRQKYLAMAGILNNFGVLHYRKGEFQQALKFFTMAARLAQELKNTQQTGKAFNGLGLVYSDQGNYPLALEYNLKAMKKLEECGDKSGMADVIGNLGGVYLRQGELTKALDYYSRVIKMKEELGETYAVALNTSNLGIIFAQQGDLNEALKHFLRAFDLYQKFGGKKGMALALGNIGNVYMSWGEQCQKQNNKGCDTLSTRAIDYNLRALEIQKELGDKAGMAMSYSNLGTLFLQTKEFKKAEEVLFRSLELSKEIGYLEYSEATHEILFGIYSRTNQWEKALKHYMEKTKLRDSIFNEENTRKTVRLEMNYEFEKKEAATRLEQEKREALAAADRRRQQLIILGIGIILVFVLAFAVFAYRSYLRKQKDNLQITRQKQIIEEKQKEIVDSIYYARRIQKALLPNEKYLSKVLGKIR